MPNNKLRYARDFLSSVLWVRIFKYTILLLFPANLLAESPPSFHQYQIYHSLDSTVSKYFLKIDQRVLSPSTPHQGVFNNLYSTYTLEYKTKFVLPHTAHPAWGIYGPPGDFIFFSQVDENSITFVNATHQFIYKNRSLPNFGFAKRYFNNQIALLHGYAGEYDSSNISILEIDFSSPNPVVTCKRPLLSKGWRMQTLLNPKLKKSTVKMFDFIEPNVVFILFKDGYALIDTNSDSPKVLKQGDFGGVSVALPKTIPETQVLASKRGAWLVTDTGKFIFIDFLNNQVLSSFQKISEHNGYPILLDTDDDGNMSYDLDGEVYFYRLIEENLENIITFPPRKITNLRFPVQTSLAFIPKSKEWLMRDANPESSKVEEALRAEFKRLFGDDFELNQEKLTASLIKKAFLNSEKLDKALQKTSEGALLAGLFIVKKNYIGFNSGNTQLGLIIPAGSEETEVSIRKLAEDLTAFTDCKYALAGA